MDNNPLYQDVIIDRNIDLDQQALVRITQQPSEASDQQPAEVCNNQPAENLYVAINNVSRDLRASWNQSTSSIFTSAYAGVQCCAMALANVVRALIHTPNQWNQSILDQNLIAGDDIYGQIYSLTAEQENALSIPESGHLMVHNFDVIKQDFSMYSKNFSIEYNENPSLFGCLMDSVNRKDGIGNTLNDSMQNLFNDHAASILIAEGKSYGVIYH